jgi:hypothetical protein
MNRWWSRWCKALGERVSDCDKESDKVAWVRTFLIVQAIITNIFIVANCLHHWFDPPPKTIIYKTVSDSIEVNN